MSVVESSYAESARAHRHTVSPALSQLREFKKEIEKLATPVVAELNKRSECREVPGLWTAARTARHKFKAAIDNVVAGLMQAQDALEGTVTAIDRAGTIHTSEPDRFPPAERRVY